MMNLKTILVVLALVSFVSAISDDNDYSMDNLDLDDHAVNAIELNSGKSTTEAALENLRHEVYLSSKTMDHNVTDAEGSAIGALLDGIEARLMGSYDKTWNATVGAAKINQANMQTTVDTAKSNLSTATSGKTTSTTALAEANAYLAAQWTFNNSMKAKMLAQLVMINSIRHFLLTLDVAQSFLWGFSGGGNNTGNNWISAITDNIITSDTDGNMNVNGNGVFQATLAGVYEFYYFGNMYNGGINTNSNDYYLRLATDNQSDLYYVQFAANQWRSVELKKHIKLGVNASTRLWILQGLRNSSIHTLVGSLTHNYTQVRLVTENNEVSDSTGKKVAQTYCSNNTRSNGSQEWFKYCANSTSFQPTYGANVVPSFTWDAEGNYTVGKNGNIRVNAEITQGYDGDWQNWSGRGIKLDWCPQNANCRTLSVNIHERQYFATIFLDFTWPMLKGDTFNISVKTLNAGNTYVYLWGQAYNTVNIEYTGPTTGKYSQPLWVGGCARQSGKFAPIGAIPGMGGPVTIAASNVEFNIVLDTANRWLPICNNVTNFSSFGDKLIAAGDGHFCVNSSGYYHIHSQVNIGYSQSNPYSTDRWIHQYTSFYIKGAMSLKNTDEDAPGFMVNHSLNQYMRGRVSSRMDLTVPLHRGQCFILIQYYACGNNECPSNTPSCKGAYKAQMDTMDLTKGSGYPNNNNGSSHTIITKVGEGGAGYKV